MLWLVRLARAGDRLLPSDAAKIARDEAGPSLGRQIVGLSGRWRHVHLIGHSAGSWLINEAACVVASQTSASIHLTFLDAYVPKGWDPGTLGRLPAIRARPVGPSITSPATRSAI